jgi:hypothetical protein
MSAGGTSIAFEQEFEEFVLDCPISQLWSCFVGLLVGCIVKIGLSFIRV